ncbi:zf-HC2 domain-containing protein [Candidatus Formimonas warabiya]|uniref:Putative zinc-finger domain-containing protein n=1 Tax=Formimonas warabiya TaxID=1761012 RepID=A0A3G1KSF7_FORW1|nr:zf-HC2 domain-containing protein [Candidatus Formimonas warabiya]ATW25381.1 hypothetical protein DCMF_11915 [Candidatus Formimonas warabiya]
MMIKECNLIRELLPLYAESLVSEETRDYIKTHLAGCADCAREWEMFSWPLPDPIPEELSPRKSVENRLFGRLRKTIIVALLLLMMGGTGLAYASYNAGKQFGMDDPIYQYAQELGLFTEIKETKTLDDLQVTIDTGLFDSTRSVLFIRLSQPGKTIPQVSLTDENGQQYEQKSGKGWQNKFFMFEFEPLALETQQAHVFLAMEGRENEQVEFSFPVDVLKTAQYTTIIYPNQEKKLSQLQMTLEKVVLGVSESEFKVQLDWPVDGSVAGISLGKGIAYFPTSVTKAPDTPPPPGSGAPPPGGLMSGYAATMGVFYRAADPPENRPVLYDLTGRQEIEVQRGEYRTTQFPCQVVATLDFAPVKQDTGELELLLPPVYLYQTVRDQEEIALDLTGEGVLHLGRELSFPGGKVVIEEAWREKDRVYLSYKLETRDGPETYVPHFTLKNDQDQEKQEELYFDREKPNVIVFPLRTENITKARLDFDSIGRLLPREKFVVNTTDKSE